MLICGAEMNMLVFTPCQILMTCTYMYTGDIAPMSEASFICTICILFAGSAVAQW